MPSFLFSPLKAGGSGNDPGFAHQCSVADVLPVLVEGDVPGPVAVQGRTPGGVRIADVLSRQGLGLDVRRSPAALERFALDFDHFLRLAGNVDKRLLVRHRTNLE